MHSATTDLLVVGAALVAGQLPAGTPVQALLLFALLGVGRLAMKTMTQVAATAAALHCCRDWR